MVAAVVMGCAACGFPALPALDRPFDAQPGAQSDAPPADTAPAIDAVPMIDVPPAIDAAPGSGDDGPPPRLDVALDPPTLATELKTSTTFTATLTGSNGFAGAVDLTASVGNPTTGASIAGWTTDLDASQVQVPLNGMATVHLTLRIPTLATALAAKLKLSATSALTSGASEATSSVTVTNQVTWNVAVVIDAGVAKCTYPADGGTKANVVPVSLNTKLRFLNTGATDFVIHGDGVLPHQSPTNPTPPGSAYEAIPTGLGTVSWYCHTPTTDLGSADPTFVVQ